MKLTREVAPAYWTRWAVHNADGERLGTVEKRGGFSSGWHTLDASGHLVASMSRTRADAIDVLTRCSQCSPGHTGKDGLCQRHGKEVTA